MKTRYYRKNYVIGIYTNDDLEQCIAILDNTTQFAKYLHITQKKATVKLHRLWNGQNTTVIIRDKKYRVCFIDFSDEE